MRTVVFYHANCPDGFCAAFIVKCKYPEAILIPCNYNERIQFPLEKDDIVYIVDFSFDRETVLHMSNTVQFVHMYDHHKTAEANFMNIGHNKLRTIFFQDKSGAKITAVELGEYRNYKTLVDYVEDRDLWKFILPHSKAVNLYIQTIPYDFESWLRLAYDIENLDRIIEHGYTIMNYQKQLLARATAHEYVIKFGKLTVAVVNSPLLQSEIGDAISDGVDFAVIWYQHESGMYIYSLRSSKTGADVAEIAKSFGGGGHKHAAGFSSKERMFEVDEGLLKVSKEI